MLAYLDLTAPGGYLVIADSDLLVYTTEEPPPPDGTPHDIEARMSGPGVIHSINNIMTGLALERGFVIGYVPALDITTLSHST